MEPQATRAACKCTIEKSAARLHHGDAQPTSPQEHFLVTLLRDATSNECGCIPSKNAVCNREHSRTSCMRLQSKITEGKGRDSPVQYVPACRVTVEAIRDQNPISRAMASLSVPNAPSPIPPTHFAMRTRCSQNASKESRLLASRVNNNTNLENVSAAPNIQCRTIQRKNTRVRPVPFGDPSWLIFFKALSTSLRHSSRT